jgi:hypothetical protein
MTVPGGSGGGEDRLGGAGAGVAGDDAGGEGEVQGAGGGQHERQERPWTPKPKR